jgi:hypothetical protein
MDHSQSITVQNTPIGTPASSDGVMMFFCQAIAVTNYFALEHAYLLTKKADLDALHINALYDSNNGLAVYQQISEFYDEAGDGALCWLVGTSKAGNSNAFATYVATAGFANLIKGTSLTDTANRAKMIGLCYAIPSAFQVAADFPADVPATLAAMQIVKDSLFNQGYPIQFILDGFNMSASISLSGLTSAVSYNAPAGSLCITGSKQNGISSVGACLGRFARISVGHALMTVIPDGPVKLSAAYLTNGTLNTIPSENTIVYNTLYYVSAGSVTYNGTVYTVGDQFTGLATPTYFTGTGTINAVSGTETTSGNIATAAIYLVKIDTITYDTNTYAVGDVFTGTAVTTFTGSGKAYLLGNDITATGAVVEGVTYLVSIDTITYNSITYNPGDTFLGLSSPSTFTGNGLVNAQAIAVKDLTGGYVGSDVSLLGQKQFLFVCTLEGYSGYYWNDGATCCDPTLPLSAQEFGRVANKLTSEIRAFMNGKKGNVLMDTKTGNPDKGYTNSIEQDFYNTYITPLKAGSGTADITDAKMTLTGTAVGAWLNWQFTLTIVGTQMTGTVTGTIAFSTTL